MCAAYWRKCSWLVRELAGREEAAVNKAGGGDGKVGERRSVVGKGDWEKPGSEGRFSLPLDILWSLTILPSE